MIGQVRDKSSKNWFFRYRKTRVAEALHFVLSSVSKDASAQSHEGSATRLTGKH